MAVRLGQGVQHVGLACAGKGPRALLSAVAVGLMLVLAPLGNDAWAQSRGLFPSHGGSPLGDFFSALFGGRPSYRPVEQPRIIVTPRIIYGSPSYSGGGHGYCVRTCDGRYFPLPGRAGSDVLTTVMWAAGQKAAHCARSLFSAPARPGSGK